MNSPEGRVIVAAMALLGLEVVFYKDVLGWARYWEQSLTTTGLGTPHSTVSAPGAIQWVVAWLGLTVILVAGAELGLAELAAAFAILVTTGATFALGPTALANAQQLGA